MQPLADFMLGRAATPYSAICAFALDMLTCERGFISYRVCRKGFISLKKSTHCPVDKCVLFSAKEQ